MLLMPRKVGHKSHDPCFRVFFMKARVVTFVAHCTGHQHTFYIQDETVMTCLPFWALLSPAGSLRASSPSLSRSLPPFRPISSLPISWVFEFRTV